MGEDRREAFYRDRVRSCAPGCPDFDRASVEATFGIFYTYDVYHQIMSRNLAEFGLSKSTLNILMLLKHGQPQGMLLRELGDLMLVSKANITGLIDHLEHQGYVKRVVGERDRRARFAQLTKEGKDLLELYAPTHYRNIKELLKDLTVEEKELLISLLRKTRRSLVAHAGASIAQNSECQVGQA